MAKSRLTAAEIKELKKAFQFVDKDGDGRINRSELQLVMKAIGKQPSTNELDDIIKGVDIDGNGTIELDEFVLMMSRTLKEVPIEEELNAAFKVFDRDGNGFISPAELRKAMEDLGEPLTNAELENMVRAADVNGDGQIDYKEFTTMMMKQSGLQQTDEKD